MKIGTETATARDMVFGSVVAGIVEGSVLVLGVVEILETIPGSARGVCAD